MTGFTLGMSSTAIQLIHLDGGHSVQGSQSARSIGILYPGERMQVTLSPLDGEDIAQARHLTVSLDEE